MCLDHPDRVQKAALVDILPNHHIWTHTSKDWALRSWHWPFMAQPYDFPERMMAGVDARWFMEHKLSKPGIGLGFFDPRRSMSTSAASPGRRSRARAPITAPA